MGTCKFCGKTDTLISDILQICRSCILKGNWDEVKPHIESIHSQVRKLVDLPSKAPRSESNIKLRCTLCINECSLSSGDISYCGLRNVEKNLSGELPYPTRLNGYIHGYIDRNPTNCCNAWFCPAGTSKGYPKFSKINGPEFGTYSYAAFLYGCSFNCLFCQNSSHKNFSKRYLYDAETIADQIANNEKISCICYFGGTPETQLPFTLKISNLILEKINNKRPFRICWECNGSGNSKLIEKCMEIAIKTGGNIKFDLKAFHRKLHYALCGAYNHQTLDNFKLLAEKFFGTREGVPEMSGCTLMVPGYTNYQEVELIAKFINNLNKKIPYSLLVFHGDYQMKDLPITPKEEALRCYNIAKKYLDSVNLGNKFLLGLA